MLAVQPEHDRLLRQLLDISGAMARSAHVQSWATEPCHLVRSLPPAPGLL